MYLAFAFFFFLCFVFVLASFVGARDEARGLKLAKQTLTQYL